VGVIGCAPPWNAVRCCVLQRVVVWMFSSVWLTVCAADIRLDQTGHKEATTLSLIMSPKKQPCTNMALLWGKSENSSSVPSHWQAVIMCSAPESPEQTKYLARRILKLRVCTHHYHFITICFLNIHSVYHRSNCQLKFLLDFGTCNIKWDIQRRLITSTHRDTHTCCSVHVH